MSHLSFAEKRVRMLYMEAGLSVPSDLERYLRGPILSR